MLKKILRHPLFWIFLLALILRLWQLDTFPYGFHADEVRVGWNALSILKTGVDDRGNTLALYYNTFGDFRPTGIFYLTIPSVAIFGSNEFAVRFPAALFGALTVFPLYLFLKELNKKNNLSFDIGHLALIASFLLAISPWHIGVSRATSEVVISLFFALSALYFFIRALNTKVLKFFSFSVFLFLLSYFFYHSIRILAPLFIGTLVFYYRDLIITSGVLKPTVAVFISLLLATLLLATNRETRARFSQVSILNDLDVQYELSRMPFEEGPNNIFIARLFHNKPSTYIRRFINEYAKYFSANFFLDSQVAKPARYQTIGAGLLTYVEFLLLVLGLVAVAQKKFSALPVFLLLIAPLAAALTTEDAPNLHRSLLMVPFLMIIESYGLVWLNQTFNGRRIEVLSYSLLVINLIFFLHMYFVHNKVHLPLYRNVGAKELALYLNKVQKDYDKIILTNIPDDPYPWIAFFTGRDPKIFNKDAVARENGVWSTENFVFTGQRCPSRDAFEKPEAKRLLVVDAEGCATESKLKDRADVKLIEVIKRPDDSEVYNLWSRVE